jgi:pimeloyl-ACP methyl ester carboxylesterase
MGGRILADIATYLPENTILGAAIISGAPYHSPDFFPAINPAMTSFTSQWFKAPDATLAHYCMLAAIRLLFHHDTNLGPGFLDDTAKKAAEGDDFIHENPKVSYLTRMGILGMAYSMSPEDQKRVVTRVQDNTKLFELAKAGFPLLAVHGTQDAYFDGGKMVEIVRPLFTNMEVVMLDGACHTPFVEDPFVVMDPILKFCDRLLGSS